MEKLEAIFSEIEMHDKRLTGIELKRRALFLSHPIRVIEASTQPETLDHQTAARAFGFQVCSLIWEPVKLWQFWRLLLTREYRCLWFIYYTFYSHSGCVSTRSWPFRAPITDALFPWPCFMQASLIDLSDLPWVYMCLFTFFRVLMLIMHRKAKLLSLSSYPQH